MSDSIKDVVKYAVNTIKISPEELFSLFEVSKGYDGEMYDRWLAGKVIEIAEDMGIGYSQLLVKKFSIIQSILEDTKDMSINPNWVEHINKSLMFPDRSVYSVDIGGIGAELLDVDWFNLTDINEFNSDFLDTLPEDFVSDFKSGNASMIIKLSNNPAKKDSDLFKVTKKLGLNCKSEGALMIYRVCSLLQAFPECTSGMPIDFLSTVDFWYDPENQKIIDMMLSYLRYTGCVVSMRNLFEGSLSDSKYSLLECVPREMSDKVQDGISLCEYSYSVDGFKKIGKKLRYSDSKLEMLSVLYHKYGNQSSNMYLCYDRYINVVLRSSIPDGYVGIPILPNNFDKVVITYSMIVSLSFFGYPSNIKALVDGNREYTSLFYNCLPLFLFDSSNMLSGNEYIYNPLSNNMKSMLENGDVYYSFESKDLYNLCMEYLKHWCDVHPDDVVYNKPFIDMMNETDISDVKNLYMGSLRNIKDYLCHLYKRM